MAVLVGAGQAPDLNNKYHQLTAALSWAHPVRRDE